MRALVSAALSLALLVCGGTVAADQGGNEYYPDTIVVRTAERLLYYIDHSGRTLSYPVAVGRAGMAWSGTAALGAKRAWPSWTPTQHMIEREWRRGRALPAYMPGGLNNPLGAAALYLYKDGRDTLYRIHGTNEPWTIGEAVSSGCIRMYNEDIQDLYARVGIGTAVVVE